MERSCGTFQRALRLPGPVDPEQVQANFENGALTVTGPEDRTAGSLAFRSAGSEGAKTNAESGSRAKSSSRS